MTMAAMHTPANFATEPEPASLKHLGSGGIVYRFTATGVVELHAAPGSTLRAAEVILDAGETAWQPGSIAFDATSPLALAFADAPATMHLRLELADPTGRSDYVFHEGMFP